MATIYPSDFFSICVFACPFVSLIMFYPYARFSIIRVSLTDFFTHSQQKVYKVYERDKKPLFKTGTTNYQTQLELLDKRLCNQRICCLH